MSRARPDRLARRRRARRARTRRRPVGPACGRRRRGAALFVDVSERRAHARDAGPGRRLTSSVRAWLLVAAAPMTLASPAAALPSEPWSIAVEARECPGLDALRVRALFALELGRAAERLGDETVTVTCGPPERRLAIQASKRGGTERVPKRPPDREGPEPRVAPAPGGLCVRR